ncbi:MAG: hypothetical protein MUC81_11330 [Bacteroidia bacterium]|jgi:hypothetical protein|nr:hypothetical protein [Bacteroidia bacterium]
MKYWYILSSLCFIVPSLSAQQLLQNKVYEFVVECPIYKCNILGKQIDTTMYIAPPESRFMVVDLRGDFYVIRFIINYHKNNALASGFSTLSYYTITRPQLDFKARTFKQSQFDFVVGSIITPIKLRFNPFDFSKDLTIGSSFGIKQTLDINKQLAFHYIIGFGVSTAALDSASTKGKIIRTIDLLAFSPSAGLLLEAGNAQIGIFTGLDFLSNTNLIRYEWIYQGKLWLSFGIGYSLLTFNMKR